MGQLIKRVTLLFGEAAIFMLAGFGPTLGTNSSRPAISSAAQDIQTITRIGPYREVDIPPEKLNDFDFSQDRGAWELYERRRGNLDSQITACRNKNDCSPRFAAWVNLIDHVSKIPDPLLKVQLVNGWVNTVIRYVDDGSEFNNLEAVQKYKTPNETVMKGTGLCTDYTNLKFETLKRAGFPEAHMRILNLNSPTREDADNHTVLLVNIAGANWILDNQSRQHPVDGSEAHAVEKRNFFSSLAELYLAEAYLQESTLIPVDACNNNLFRQYQRKNTSLSQQSSHTPMPSLALDFGKEANGGNSTLLVDGIIASAFAISSNADKDIIWKPQSATAATANVLHNFDPPPPLSASNPRYSSQPALP